MGDNHGYLDRFTVMRDCIVFEGWANNPEPAVFYGGEKLPTMWKKVSRPDLTSVFGEPAKNWGFFGCAILPHAEVEQDRLQFKFNRQKKIDSPGASFAAPSDMAFHAMRNGFIDHVTQTRGRMLEIGSRDRSGSSYRGWFPTVSEWVGVDIMPGPGVDIIGDAHHLSRAVDGEFDFAFSMAVFEHLLMPWKVAIELNKVLKKGGRAMIISHAAWPLHEEPWDFWRFSKEAWGGLFNDHTGFKLVDAQYQYPARIVPDYVPAADMAHMSQGVTYLLSGCIVEKVGESQVNWAGEASDVYNLNYSYS